MPFGPPYLLSGGRAGIRPGRRAGPVLLAALLFLGLLVSAVYYFWQRTALPEQPQTIAAPVSAPPSALSDPLRDDLALHLDNATRHLQQNLVFLAKAQARLAVVETALGRSYLAVEQRRLQAAEALTQNAMTQATAAFEELSVASAQLNAKEK